jgi:hypothetical protein
MVAWKLIQVSPLKIETLVCEHYDSERKNQEEQNYSRQDGIIRSAAPKVS